MTFKREFSLSIAICFLGLASAFSQEINWKTDFDQAKEVANNDDKIIMLSFAGSDWCKPCIMLTREVFETPEFSAFADENLVLLMADFPRLKKNRLSKEQTDKNDFLASKYNQEGSFPLVVLINSDGNKVGGIGYQPGGPVNYINQIKKLIGDS